MTDSAERPRVLSAASRSILSSNRRIVICKSSACSSAATISTNQDARVAGHGARRLDSLMRPHSNPTPRDHSGTAHVSGAGIRLDLANVPDPLCREGGGSMMNTRHGRSHLQSSSVMASSTLSPVTS